MTPVRILVAILGFALAALAVWTIAQTASLEDFWFEGQALTEQPWGLMALADLYVGFVFFTIVIAIAERSLVAGLLWGLPIFVFGNVWTALWLLARLPTLAKRLAGQAAA